MEGDVLIHVRRASVPVSITQTGDGMASAPDPTQWLAEQLQPQSGPVTVDQERALFSRYAAKCVEVGHSVAISADDFYRLARALRVQAEVETVIA